MIGQIAHQSNSQQRINSIISYCESYWMKTSNRKKCHTFILLVPQVCEIKQWHYILRCFYATCYANQRINSQDYEVVPFMSNNFRWSNRCITGRLSQMCIFCNGPVTLSTSTDHMCPGWPDWVSQPRARIRSRALQIARSWISWSSARDRNSGWVEFWQERWSDDLKECR